MNNSSPYKTFSLSILAAAVLTACGGKVEHFYSATPNTLPAITKGEVRIPFNQGNETTPVLFRSELLYVSDYWTTTGVYGVKVRKQSTGEVLADQPNNLYLSSAVVVGTRLYVTGISRAEGQQCIKITSTEDLVTWTPVSDTICSTPLTGKLWNSSITADSHGFVMAYEVGDGGDYFWNTRFATSPDMVHWTDTGIQYNQGYMTACPTIKYIEGKYYLFFGTHNNGGTDGHGYYATNVSRSDDLKSWEFSSTTVLSPLDGGDTSNNAADMDLVEVNGQVRIVYGNASQWSGTDQSKYGVREALYTGTLKQFVGEFFK